MRSVLLRRHLPSRLVGYLPSRCSSSSSSSSNIVGHDDILVDTTRSFPKSQNRIVYASSTHWDQIFIPSIRHGSILGTVRWFGTTTSTIANDDDDDGRGRGSSTVVTKVYTTRNQQRRRPNKDDSDSFHELRQKTQQWYHQSVTNRSNNNATIGNSNSNGSNTEPTWSWTSQDVSMARFLIDRWANAINNDLDHGDTVRSVRDRIECATQQTTILTQWLQERHNKNPHLSKHDSPELLQMLHRCLDSYRKALQMNSGGVTPLETQNHHYIDPKSVTNDVKQLVEMFQKTSDDLHDIALRPNRKTYSMLLNVLSEYPQSLTSTHDIMSILHNAHQEQHLPLDVQFYNVILNTLGKCSPYHDDAPILAESVFDEMVVKNKMDPDTGTIVALLHVWAKYGNVNGNGTIGRDHDHDRTGISANRVETILHQLIQTYPHLIDTTCFNVCIDAWARHGSPEKAEAKLQQMRTMNLHPTTISYNSTIHAWANSSKNYPNYVAAHRAEQLLQQMESNGCKPTIQSFASVMMAWSKTINSGWKVQQLLDNLELMYSMGKLNRPPSKVCYLIAIQAWGQTKSTSTMLTTTTTTVAGTDSEEGLSSPERAERLVRRMQLLARQNTSSGEKQQRSDLEPCVVTYTALIHTLVNQGGESFVDYDAPDRALAIYKEMQQLQERQQRRRTISGRNVDLAPNTVTLNALLRVFTSHGRIEEARQLLHDKEMSVQPDLTSYHTILKAYCANSDYVTAAEDAQSLVEELECAYREGNQSLQPSARTYSLLLVALGNNNSRRHDAPDLAEDVFWKLLYQRDGTDAQPTTALLNCVLRAWSKSSEGGAAERAETFLKKVQKESTTVLGDPISGDAVSHLHLIQSWAHSRRRKAHIRAETHLEEAKRQCSLKGNSNDDGGKLTRAHFNGVILAWSKSQDKDALSRVRKLLDDMRSMQALGYDTGPDQTTIHLYIKTILATGGNDRWTVAAKVIDNLKKEGSIVPQVTLDLLRKVPTQTTATG